MSQPIGEYLLHHHSGELKSEMDHPNLNEDVVKGRPRQIDFCLSSREKDRLTAAFELKWVTENQFDKQRVVDDLLRQEVLRNKEVQHVYRYFLVAGKSVNFKKNFQNSRANLGGGAGRIPFFSEFLDFNSDVEKTVNIISLSAPQREACDAFSKYYNSQLPRRFVTARVFNGTMDGFSVFIWRIRSTKSRKVLPLIANT
ncbi:hypothetical protein ACLS0R_13495 [Comamonas jiangduensis]|uniref:hypothetical protein n=1 Tax=Comamonas jiangduensis TaxID=1194168 RepID=UPI003BF879E6